MPFSFRIDPETEALIRRLAAKTGWSRANVVREAVAQYGLDQGAERPSKGVSAYDRLRPHVGVVHTGGAQYSRGTHAKYRTLLERRRRERVRKRRGRRPEAS